METLSTIQILHLMIPSPLYCGVPGDSEEDYGTIIWHDDRTQPTWGEILLYRERPSQFHSFDSSGRAWVWDSVSHIESLCDAVDLCYSDRHNLPVTYNGGSYQACVSSRMAIGERAIYALMSELDSTNYPWTANYATWRDINNVDVSFATPESFKLFAKAVNDHCNTLWATRCTHKDALRALTTFENVRDYDISTGW